MERRPSQEIEIKKEEVLEKLRKNSINDPETKRLVFAWKAQQEAWVAKEGTIKAGILRNIEMIDLYLATNGISYAEESLRGMRRQIEGDPRLNSKDRAELERALDGVEARINAEENK